MYQVIAANGQGIAVTHDGDDVELGIGHLDSCGKSQRPAVGGMDRVEIHIDSQTAGAPDARNDDHIVLGNLQRVNGADQCSQHDTMSATGTQHMREFLIMPQILVDDFISGKFIHDATPA